MAVQSFRDLIVWQKSVELVFEIYHVTKEFPREEIYGLRAQMRRAAVSIPSNIAEGSRRKNTPEYLQFLRIADASSAELETQIIITKQLYPSLPCPKAELLLNEVQKMLRAIMTKLELKT